MEFKDLVKIRQSDRGFLDKVVEHEKLVLIAEAGRLSPSACNSQPWLFHIVESPEKVKQIALDAQVLEMNPFLKTAKAFIIIEEVFAKLMPGLAGLIDSQTFAKLDIGGTVNSICLQATDLGLGTCIIGMIDRRKIIKTLGLNNETKIVSFIAIGYAKDSKIRNKIRKDISETVKFY
ncbi:MAG: nitroreductase family protein [Bacillales bacterium]|jgi:nitroreductase|nr:nitroreductase family protein [Bacillales bacterium]